MAFVNSAKRLPGKNKNKYSTANEPNVGELMPGGLEAHEAFNPDGSLKDKNHQAAIEKIGAAVANTVAKLKSQ